MLPSYRFYDVEGTSPLTLDRSVGKSLRDYKIYGNSVQDGTPSPDNPVEVESVGDKSKNLINWDYLLSSETPITKVENGYTSNDYYHNFFLYNCPDFINQIKAVLKPNVTYTLSRKYEGATAGTIGNIIFAKNEAVSVVASGYGMGLKSKTFSLTQEEIDSIDRVYVYFATSGTGTISELQLTEGEEVLPYQPYGCQIPIEICGKNLFDIDAFLALPNASKYYKKDADNNLVQVIQDFRQYKVVPVYMELPPGTYTVSLTGATQDLWLVCVNDVVVTDTFTLTETSPVKIKSFYQAGTVVGKFQLERGDTASSYEPYKEPIKTDIYLDEPLYKIGDYADYIDFKNGKVVRKNKKIALQINKDMVHYRDRGSVVTYRTDSSISLYLDNYKKSDTYNIPNMCNKFKFMSGASLTHATDEHGEWLACAYGTVYVTIRKDRLSEVTNSSVTEYVNNLNAELIYALDVPIEQPIDLPPILTHKGTNVISVGAEIQPSNMQIQYYK
jgi:hypothetical protein